MIKRIIIMLSVLLLTLSTTGCNVKFIEKVDPDKDLGNVEKTDPNLGTVPEVTEPPATPTPTPKKNTQTINGIVFEMRDDTLQVFLLEDTPTYKTPENNADIEENLLKGEPLNLIGESEDKKWYMVKHFEGSICYVVSEKISMSYVKPDTTVIIETTPSPTIDPTPVPTSTPTPKPTKKPKTTPKPKNTKKPQEKEPGNNPSNDSSKKPKTTPKPKAEKPGYKTKGIPFPKNPQSTSVNLGIKFADVDMVLRITYNNTKANSGPGKATTSTGYDVKQTFMRGDTVACTGIGENGYCRVELPNNELGFIEGIYLEVVK